MRMLTRRIEALESSSGPTDGQSRAEAGAFIEKMSGLAGRVEPNGGATLSERLAWSCAEHVAWATRFAPGVPLRHICAAHGIGITEAPERIVAVSAGERHEAIGQLERRAMGCA